MFGALNGLFGGPMRRTEMTPDWLMQMMRPGQGPAISPVSSQPLINPEAPKWMRGGPLVHPDEPYAPKGLEHPYDQWELPGNEWMRPGRPITMEQIINVRDKYGNFTGQIYKNPNENDLYDHMFEIQKDFIKEGKINELENPMVYPFLRYLIGNKGDLYTGDARNMIHAEMIKAVLGLPGNMKLEDIENEYQGNEKYFSHGRGYLNKSSVRKLLNAQNDIRSGKESEIDDEY